MPRRLLVGTKDTLAIEAEAEEPVDPGWVFGHFRIWAEVARWATGPSAFDDEAAVPDAFGRFQISHLGMSAFDTLASSPWTIQRIPGAQSANPLRPHHCAFAFRDYFDLGVWHERLAGLDLSS